MPQGGSGNDIELLHSKHLVGFFTTAWGISELVLWHLYLEKINWIIFTIFKFRCCALVLLQVSKLEISLFTRPKKKCQLGILLSLATKKVSIKSISKVSPHKWDLKAEPIIDSFFFSEKKFF